jgi:flagellar biosynthetic protein FliQ
VEIDHARVGVELYVREVGGGQRAVGRKEHLACPEFTDVRVFLPTAHCRLPTDMSEVAMDTDAVLHIGREALLLVLILSAVPVLSAMAVGLIVSIAQAATQIQEQTLTFVPKVVATFLALAIGGLWMLQQLVEFSVTLFESIGQIGR